MIIMIILGACFGRHSYRETEADRIGDHRGGLDQSSVRTRVIREFTMYGSSGPGSARVRHGYAGWVRKAVSLMRVAVATGALVSCDSG